MAIEPEPLLSPDEPHPLEVFNADGGSDFFLICEHAGRLIPKSMGTMGLSEEDRRRHIAWDIGARDVSLALARRLDAPLFMQRYSRLVCDCNRRTDVPSFAPAVSERTTIPANQDLAPEEIERRARAIFHPFHDAVTRALDRRDADGRRTILVTVHSFTPVFMDVPRPWQIGVLFHRDRDFAPEIARHLGETTSLTVGVNQPYSIGDETDYAIPVHGEKRGYPCVEFEIRNDLTEGERAVEGWAELIAGAVRYAAARLIQPAPS